MILASKRTEDKCTWIECGILLKLRRYLAKLVLKLNINTEKLPYNMLQKKQRWNVNIFSSPPQQEMTMHEIDKKSLQQLEHKKKKIGGRAWGRVGCCLIHS